MEWLIGTERGGTLGSSDTELEGVSQFEPTCDVSVLVDEGDEVAPNQWEFTENGCNCGASAINRLTPNDPYMGRTAPLTSKRFIIYIYIYIYIQQI